MSRERRQRRRGSAHLLPRLVLRVACALAATASLAASLASGAESGPAPLTAQPVIGAPEQMVLIGSSPLEASGETWGYEGSSLLRYTNETGVWERLPPPLDSSGRRLEGFAPGPGSLAGSVTPGGDVAIVGQDSEKAEQVLVRDAGGAFREAPAPSEATTTQPGATATQSEPPLRKGETLTGGGNVLLAAVEQPGRRAGAFLVPFESAGAQDGVLFYDGSSWSREPICEGLSGSACKAPADGFSVLGIGATSAQNAWLLAKVANSSEGIALFSRETTAQGPEWRQRSLGSSPFARIESTFGEVHVRVADLSARQQPLTVTSQGVWVDGALTLSSSGTSAQNTTFTLFYEPSASAVKASWCELPGAFASEVALLCPHTLPEQLPSGPHRSFGWSGGTPYGSRVITGFDGVSLSLNGESFERVLGLGGGGGQEYGAAFSSPEEGWLGGFGSLTHLTRSPAPDLLQAWPVPFREPLTAIAEQPGASSGDLGAQAIAVGNDGEIAHYEPGRGWVPEVLMDSEGQPPAKPPELRGVAWPTPNSAFAVGTEDAMWMWRAETGLWEPDPASPPSVALANFTGIAFDPTEPQRGYAIGQQGVLLSYGKSWTPEALPPGLQGADLTSIAFAGNEALVTYQIPHFYSSTVFAGGLLVNDGSGWRVDAGAAAVLKGSPPERVAGLPDGGAAMVDDVGDVFLRQSAEAPWQPSAAGQPGGSPVALAAFREGATLRAAVSVEETVGAGLRGYYAMEESVDSVLENEVPAGQPPIATGPYPLPVTGYLLRETPHGWSDQEHQDYPSPGHIKSVDWPYVPDSVLALALAPDGSQGWAVGGQTGELNQGHNLEYNEAIRTAGVMRYSTSGGAAPSGFAPAPVTTSTANATFAIGGGAQCVYACADLLEDQLGPDAWLTNAIARAGQTPGVRAFLYTGPHVASGIASASASGNAGFRREVESYAGLLAGAAGPPTGTAPAAGAPPAVFAAPSTSDLNAEGKLTTFGAAFAALGAPQGSAPPPPGVGTISAASPQTGVYYYSFLSTGAGGPVRVIVLDYSSATLGVTQQCWLANQLAQARAAQTPAIVVGNRAVSGEENLAEDAATVSSILVTGVPSPGSCTPAPSQGSAGSASAYFFESPGANRVLQVTASGAPPIPAFGSGTLGYVSAPPRNHYDFVGASGFLLAEIEVSKRETGATSRNRAPVSVRLIPDISDLALDPRNGVLLRRSHEALFDALARRPRAGMLCIETQGACTFEPDPYVPIPSNCSGAATCATGIQPYYTFTSSDPEVGDFVEPDPASPEGTTVLQGANGKPIPDPYSGLFCAYNAGTTTVTVQAGGLASSQVVTVQPGSVEQPCGTVRLKNPPNALESTGALTPLLEPEAPPSKPSPVPPITVPQPPPLPPTPKPRPVKRRKPTVAQVFPFIPVAGLALLKPALPPPAPTAGRPTPPSGTSSVQVYQSAVAPERQREEKEAVDIVHNMAAYSHDSARPIPSYLPAVILLLAFSAAGLCDAARRRRPEPARNGGPLDEAPCAPERGAE